MGYDRLVGLLRQLIFEILEQKREYRHGLLGDGEGNVTVTGRVDYVYVRESKDSSKIMQILNKRVDGVDGTPVLYGELPWQPGVIQVVSIDWDTYSRTGGGWGGDSYTGVPIHHRAHQYPSEDEKGSDAVLVYQPAVQMLKTVPNSGYNVDVNKLIFYDNQQMKIFAGATVDLSAYIPTSGYKKYILLSLNVITNSVTITSGGEVADVDTVQAPMPSCPADDIPSAYILLNGGTTEITTSKISDARGFLSSGDLVSYIISEDGFIVTDETGQFVVL